MNWRNYPLLFPAICLTTGIALAEAHIERMNPLWLLSGCGIAVIGMLACLVNMPTSISPPQKLRLWGFGVASSALFLLAGMALYTCRSMEIIRLAPRDSSACRGIITSEAKEKARSWAMHMTLDNGAHIIIYIGKSKTDPIRQEAKLKALSEGDSITALLKHVTLTNTRGDDFDNYRRRLMNRGICATAYVPPDKWRGKTLPSCRSQAPSRHVLQAALHSIYEDRFIDGEAGSTIEAMTIGRTADIGKRTRLAYSRAGASHLLALSGFHVGIVVMMLSLLLRIMPDSSLANRLMNVAIVAAIWCYAHIAGMSPSLIRATIACSLVTLAHMTRRHVLPINICLLSLMTMLCIAPTDLFNMGFQLSYLSVIGICVTSRTMEGKWGHMNAWLKMLISSTAISVVCTLMTAPVVAYHFGSVPALSVLTNILSVAFVYVIVCGSALWWATLWIAPVNSALGCLLTKAATMMNDMMEWISSLPFASITFSPDVTTICIYYLILTIFASKILNEEWHRRNWKLFHKES